MSDFGFDYVAANTNTTTVTITLKEYTELVVKADYVDLIFDAIYDGARLNYYGNGLTLDGENVDAVLKVLDNQTYHEIVKMLQEKKKQEEKDDTL